jgi:hypothetical protein
VISRGVVAKMSQANLPIFGIGCETGASTPDFRKFGLVAPSTRPPPPQPQPYNAKDAWRYLASGPTDLLACTFEYTKIEQQLGDRAPQPIAAPAAGGGPGSDGLR